MCDPGLFRVEASDQSAVNCPVPSGNREAAMGRESLASDRLVTIAFVADHYVCARVGHVVTFYWMRANSLPAVEALAELCEQVSAARTRPFSAVQIVRPGLGLPDAPARHALSAAMKKYAQVSSCIAIVTPGAGFWVSALQGAITGIRMLSPAGGSMLRFITQPE